MKIRVLVIDDSAFNRQTITQLLEESGEVEVIGRAADGEEGLRLVFQLQPDVITLDLEMPRMDGFSFLRLLMARRPTPVVVISGYATRENVFKALELGALDFVAKPSRQITHELRNIRDELIGKVKLVTQLKMVNLVDRSRVNAQQAPAAAVTPTPAQAQATLERVFAIGASTGGPPAIQQLLVQLDPTWPAAIVITQHMPVKFTRAFAERLDRATQWRVMEAEGGEVLAPGCAYIAPGSHSMLLRRENEDRYRLELEPPQQGQRFTPSVNRMFESAAKAVGSKLVACVLTGMGGDGAVGVRAVKAEGGYVMAESPETAVIFGMPQESIATGAVDEVVPLHGVVEALRRRLRSGGG